MTPRQLIADRIDPHVGGNTAGDRAVDNIVVIVSAVRGDAYGDAGPLGVQGDVPGDRSGEIVGGGQVVVGVPAVEYVALTGGGLRLVGAAAVVDGLLSRIGAAVAVEKWPCKRCCNSAGSR